MTRQQIILVYVVGIGTWLLTPWFVGVIVLFFFAHINGDIRVIREGEEGQ